MSNNIWNGPIAVNEQIGDDRFEAAIMELKSGLRKAPKITRDEYEVLEFCHNRNMKEFLREEFRKHPIVLNENGELVGENPFDKERRELLEQQIHPLA